MFKINNKVKVHCSIRLVILEKMKIISYKNLEKTWAKHAAKKKAIIDKEKHNSKYKSSIVELKSEV